MIFFIYMYNKNSTTYITIIQFVEKAQWGWHSIGITSIMSVSEYPFHFFKEPLSPFIQRADIWYENSVGSNNTYQASMKNNSKSVKKLSLYVRGSIIIIFLLHNITFCVMFKMKIYDAGWSGVTHD